MTFPLQFEKPKAQGYSPSCKRIPLLQFAVGAPGAFHHRFTVDDQSIAIQSKTTKQELGIMKPEVEQLLTVKDKEEPDSFFHLCTRSNSEYKWRTSSDVIGCLEVPSEPTLMLGAKYLPRPVTEHSEAFEKALRIWHELKLQKEFLQACEGTAKATCCFGLLANDDETIRSLVPDLNRGWIRATNRRLIREGYNFQLDCTVWNWQNALGKTETNILLIRFRGLTPSLSFSTLESSSTSTISFYSSQKV